MIILQFLIFLVVALVGFFIGAYATYDRLVEKIKKLENIIDIQEQIIQRNNEIWKEINHKIEEHECQGNIN